MDKTIAKIDAIRKQCNKEATAEKIAELLSDPRTNTEEMFEDLAFRYVKEGNTFRDGVDTTLSILIGHNMIEIAEMLA